MGKVSGDVMITTMTRAKNGTDPLPWLHGLAIEWFLLDGEDPADDVLVNSFDEEFARAD